MTSSTMARMPDLTAVGLSLSLSALSATAWAQPGDATSTGTSVYSPPPPSSDIYRPAPARPYEPHMVGSHSSVMPPSSANSARPVVYETRDWFQQESNRWLTFGIATGIVLLVTAGIFYVIHTHKDEEEGEKKV